MMSSCHSIIVIKVLVINKRCTSPAHPFQLALIPPESKLKIRFSFQKHKHFLYRFMASFCISQTLILLNKQLLVSHPLVWRFLKFHRCLTLRGLIFTLFVLNLNFVKYFCHNLQFKWIKTTGWFLWSLF